MGLILTRGVNGPLQMNIWKKLVFWTGVHEDCQIRLVFCQFAHLVKPHQSHDYRASKDQNFNACCTLCRSKALFTRDVSVCVNVTVNVNFNSVFLVTQTQ